LHFQDAEIRKLKQCFDSLDDDGEGSIGVEELEGPLIGLGFAESREEVKEIVDEVDDDKSGEIEFDEFLAIIHNSDANEKSEKIFEFFKGVTNGTFKAEEDEITAEQEATKKIKLDKKTQAEVDAELSFTLVV
jgi:Ca2+-binding EF-hand superfamily protein